MKRLLYVILLAVTAVMFSACRRSCICTSYNAKAPYVDIGIEELFIYDCAGLEERYHELGYGDVECE